MAFKLIETKKNGVRIGKLKTSHGEIETPFFMPVGTVGSVKGVSSEELNALGANIILCNTYHLYLRPGEKIIKKLGGIHNFVNWQKPILTDSGGYQVFSLGQEKTKGKTKENSRAIKSLVRITEDGAVFKSFLDGSEHLFTPEKVIDIQLDLGVDILMPLDYCPSGKATKEEIREACRITIDWARRSKAHFEKQMKKSKIKNCDSKSQKFIRPLLHGIVQGGLYEDLRRWCAEELIKLDFDGYSVGGLAVDNETRDMWETVKLMGEILPKNKQRYLMGVGTPDDILKATRLGMDMFDCVLPTRLGRHGNVYIKSKAESRKLKGREYELVNLLKSEYREDGGVIDPECGCPACKGGYKKMYISHLARSGEILGIRLTTLHNLWQYLDLLRLIRA